MVNGELFKVDMNYEWLKSWFTNQKYGQVFLRVDKKKSTDDISLVIVNIQFKLCINWYSMIGITVEDLGDLLGFDN